MVEAALARRRGKTRAVRPSRPTTRRSRSSPRRPRPRPAAATCVGPGARVPDRRARGRLSRPGARASKPRWGAPLERFRRKMAARPRGRALDRRAPGGPGAELARGFAVEASGWKGESGTAILSDERTAVFYREIAQRLRRARRAAPVADRARRPLGGVRPLPAPPRPALPAEDRLRRALPHARPRPRDAAVDRRALLRARPGGARAAGRRDRVEAQVRHRRAPPRGLPRLRARASGQLELHLPRHAPGRCSSAPTTARSRAYGQAASEAGRRAGSPGSPVSSATSICAFWSLPA